MGVGVLWANALNSAANAAFYENLLVEKGIKAPTDSFTDNNGGERPLWESVVNAPANDPWAATAPANDPWAAPAPADDSSASGEGANSSKSVNPDN